MGGHRICQQHGRATACSGARNPAHTTAHPSSAVLHTCPASSRGVTAAILTTQSLTEGINSRADLVGRAVGTWEEYVPKLRAEGLAAVGFKW